MKKIVLALALSIFIIGCSSQNEEIKDVVAKLVVGKSISDIELKDQFDSAHKINEKTTKLIFAFSKDVAHTCNDFFVTQGQSYLYKNNSQFIADLSAAPAIIKNLFILPGLKDFKHVVLLLNDETVAAAYRKGVDTEKIVVVFLENKKIVSIKTIGSEDELKSTIEAK